MIRGAAFLALLTLSACMTAPEPPATIAPTSATDRFADLPVASIEPVPDDWWRLFDDPQLDPLVLEALAANRNLAVAYANLDASRASLRRAQAARLPQTVIESGATVDNAAAQPSTSTVPSTDWDLAATASWDIDLFGGLRSAALAADADAQAQQAALDGVKVAVAADTVLAYVELCGATRSADVAREVAAAQDRAVALTRQQLMAGEVSPLEVSQLATLAASTRAIIAPFEAQRMNALYRLATLRGLPPAEAREFELTCSAIPELHEPVPVGDGAALLLRRPDIREAERRLAAAAARIGVARADLYPRIHLGGAIGLLTGAFDAAASPLISWTFPNQTPARARIAEAQATERVTLAQWDVAVLGALREVETALTLYDAEVKRNAQLGVASDEARAYATRADARVRLGEAGGLLSADAHRARASAELEEARSDLAIAQAQVDLFRALGGGWRTGTPPR